MNFKRVIEELFNVYDKSGTLVPFKLNSIQKQIDNELKIKRRVSILKFRQGGVSTYIMARFLIECATSYQVAVMIAHDKEHTERLLERSQLILKKMNGKVKTSKMNDNEIRFDKTDSTFYIGTAGSKDFGRSATITRLHCSEIAFWKDPKRLLTGLLQSVPKETGVIIQETTGNGWGTWFQQRFYQYIDGRGGFDALFYPWYIHEEYISKGDLFPTLLDEDEIELKTKYNLSDAQLKWRREKIEEFEGDTTLFKQEYPTTIEDSFKLTGGSLFSDAKILESKDWIRNDQYSFKLESHPKPNHNYILGADSSGGTGNDFSSINILCQETGEQVYRYSNRNISPPKFAEHIMKIGKEYNEAYLIPESNSHGLSVLSILKDSYPHSKIYKHVLNKGKTLTNSQHNMPSYGYGWKTSETSKAYMIGLAQKYLPLLIIYDRITCDELISFTETEEGKLEGMGENDDNAISYMLAVIGLNKLNRLKPEMVEKEPLILSKRDDNGNYLIPFQNLFEGDRKKEKKWRRIHALPN